MMCLEGRQKMIVACDWLSFSGQLILDKGEPVSEPWIECPQGYRLEILSGTNVFKCRAILYSSRGEKILTALWCPYSSAMNRRLINFEIANYWLYQWNLDSVCRLTYALHNYTFLCITRLDVAVDFESSKRIQRIISGLNKGTYYVAAKREGSIFWSQDYGTKYPHCLSYGSKKSDFKWKLYNKSKELDVTSNKPQKPYIWQNWQAFGMNIVAVWRLELSITKGNGFKVNGRSIDLQDALSDNFLVRLLGSMMESRFVIRKAQRHSRKSNDKVVDFLYYPFEGLECRTAVSKGSEVEPKACTQLMKLCEVLESPMAMANEALFDSVVRSMCLLMSKYKLSKYFIKVKGQTWPNFLAQQRELIGTGVIDLESKERLSMAEISEYTNACWLKKKYLELRR